MVALRPPEAGLVSRNFATAKVLAILLVATGHFFADSPLWLAASIGLFVFGFSSGYFSAQKYGGRFQAGPFWAAKGRRLLLSLLVLNAVLLALFLVQGRDGLLSWQTLLAMVGLSGWLDWLGQPNPSPFGQGLWFLTLLLLYYAAFPLIDRPCRQHPAQVGLVALALTTLLQATVPMSHMLWMTVAAFLCGHAAAGLRVPASPWIARAALLGAVGMLALAYALDAPALLRYLALLGLALAAVLQLLGDPWPGRLLAPLGTLGGCVLQIYVLHPYLFVRPAGWPAAAAWALSLALILAAAWTLHHVTERVLRGHAAGTRTHPA